MVPIDLVVERRFRHSADRVWEALTQPDLLAEWFWTLDFRPQVGWRFKVEGEPAPGWRGFTDCEILALDPPRKMVWSFACVDDAPPSTVVFELFDAPGGARLVLTHTGEVPAETRALLDAGWNTYVPRIDAVLDRG
jgi:uncharacterized protein YndB with AHSA1/START domain